MAPKPKNIKKAVESAESGLDVLKGLFKKPAKAGEAVADTKPWTNLAGETVVPPVVPVAPPTPGLVSRTAAGIKSKTWTDRSPAGKAVTAAILGGQVLPASINIAKDVVPGLVQSPLGAWKDVFGISDQPATTEIPGQYAIPPVGVEPTLADILAGYPTQGEQSVLDAVARATGGSAAGGAAVPGLSAGERGDIAAQQKAIEAATTAGGGSVSNLVTPVSGSAARGLESLTNMTKQQQDYLDFVQRAAKASGVKLAGNWRQKYLDQILADRRKKEAEVEGFLLKDRVRQYEAAQAAKAGGVYVPDAATIAKAVEDYRKQSDAEKYRTFVASGGVIRDETSLIQNLGKLQQPQG